MKITGATSSSELAVLRGKYGVVRMTFDFSFEMVKPVFVILLTENFKVRGRGETEAEALDDAYSRLEHRIGADIWQQIFLKDAIFNIGGTVKLFPDHWANPTVPFEIVPTPLGTRCYGCNWKICPTDRGLLVPYIGDEVPPPNTVVPVVEKPWHRECFLRTLRL